MNIEKTNNKSYSSWKKLLLKDFCKKCIVKNTDKKHSLVFTNSAIYGIVKQADYFEKDVANSDNTDSYYVVKRRILFTTLVFLKMPHMARSGQMRQAK